MNYFQKTYKFYLFILFLTSGSVFFLNPIFLVQAKDDSKSIQLPSVNLELDYSLMQALKQRKSDRGFSDKELSLDMIANLLWAANGINRDNGKRTAPSAFNHQEIDIYVAMKKGVYFYNPSKNILEFISGKDIRAITGRKKFTQEAPINLIYVANFAKMKRGTTEEKTILAATDVGFVSQNVYLFSAANDLATVILGGVEKEKLAAAMNLTNAQIVLYTQPVGYPD